MISRVCLIVYFKTPRVLKKIKEINEVAYFHKHRRYAVIYVDKTEVKKVTAKLKELKAVKKVEESQFDMEQFDFDLNVK